MYTVGIITSSDKGYAGEREDKSGAVVKEIVEANGFEVVKYIVLPDDQQMLEDEFKKMCDELKVNLVLSTGGTGFSKRDITPEATKAIIEREHQEFVKRFVTLAYKLLNERCYHALYQEFVRIH